MVEQNIGFRFDIYERVHLPEGTLAIRELEQIELTPYFQGMPGKEQTQLRGNLQLTAIYDSVLDGASKQTFIHRIPVEISLPIRTNEINSQEIQVQIDQFDVELVTNRSMNVTGILSLAGWEQIAAEGDSSHSDEFYAVHQAESPDLGRMSEEEPAHLQAVESEEPDTTTVEEMESPSEPLIKEQEIQIKQDELDMKIAIKPQQQEEFNNSMDEAPVKSEKANNSLEWKRLFLIKDEASAFKQLRMCIAQKEDTLETIAHRYELQPREIALYNRLGEMEISEGQIIYIPKSKV